MLLWLKRIKSRVTNIFPRSNIILPNKRAIMPINILANNRKTSVYLSNLHVGN